MDIRLQRCVVLVLFSLVTPTVLGESRSLERRTAERVAKKLTAEARRAGARGDQQRRTTLLTTALDKAPDYGPAHWQLGHIQAGDDWLELAEVQELAANDETLIEYERRRSAVSGDPRANKALAKWCEHEGLFDEARVHWMAVLQTQPRDREALGKLGLEWRGDRLVERDAPRRAEEVTPEMRRQQEQWSRKVARWARSRQPREGRPDPIADEVRSITDEAAIPAFERLASTLDADPNTQQRATALCHAFLEALDMMGGPVASESLVRHAVFTEDPEVRQAAADALVGAPLEECVPLLLSGLQPLTESEFGVTVAANGDVAYAHRVTTKGREANQEVLKSRYGSFQQQGILLTRAQAAQTTAADSNLRTVFRQRLASEALRREYQTQARELEQQIAASNLSSTSINARVVPVLSAVTGQDFGNQPQDWWDYWDEYRGYETSRDTQREYDHDTDTLAVGVEIAPLPPPPSSPRCECFVAGTPVVTKIGAKAIESLEPGDLVLSRDTSTGELSFRPVLATTVREPSPMVVLRVEGEEIHSTVGHPFWVESRGWRMAKELRVGDRLNGVDRSPRVESVEPADDAVAYNLVVEGPANYFVGAARVLAHDNTPAEAPSGRLALR